VISEVKYTAWSVSTSAVASNICHTDQALTHNNLLKAFNNNLADSAPQKIQYISDHHLQNSQSNELPAEGQQNSVKKGAVLYQHTEASESSSVNQ
jgi:hypothetical protein